MSNSKGAFFPSSAVKHSAVSRCWPSNAIFSSFVSIRSPRVALSGHLSNADGYISFHLSRRRDRVVRVGRSSRHNEIFGRFICLSGGRLRIFFRSENSDPKIEGRDETKILGGAARRPRARRSGACYESCEVRMNHGSLARSE